MSLFWSLAGGKWRVRSIRPYLCGHRGRQCLLWGDETTPPLKNTVFFPGGQDITCCILFTFLIMLWPCKRTIIVLALSFTTLEFLLTETKTYALYLSVVLTATYYIPSPLPFPNHFSVCQENSIPVKTDAAHSSKMSLSTYDNTQF
jgi:hypothetical protein